MLKWRQRFPGGSRNFLLFDVDTNFPAIFGQGGGEGRGGRPSSKGEISFASHWRAMALRQRPSRGGGSPTEPEARGKLNRLLWISLHFSRLLPTCVCSKGSASLLKHRRGRGHPTWAGNNTEAPTLLSYLFSQGWRLVLRLGCRPSRGCGAGRPASPSTRPNCGPDPLPGPLSGPIVQSHCSVSCHWGLPLFC